MPALQSVTRSTLREIQRVLPRQRAYTQDIKRVLNDKVQKAQKNFLDNFEKHPVTMEIAAGASATNISGTLGGIGNLFSYIGFSAGSQPLAALRPLLAEYEIRYHHTKNKTIINRLSTKYFLYDFHLWGSKGKIEIMNVGQNLNVYTMIHSKKFMGFKELKLFKTKKMDELYLINTYSEFVRFLDNKGKLSTNLDDAIEAMDTFEKFVYDKKLPR